MKGYIASIICLLFIGCGDDLSINSNKSQNSKIDSITLNNSLYLQYNLEDRFDCLITSKGDTIIRSKNYYHSIDYVDINNDSFIDLKVFMMGREPNGCEIYLFDKTTRKYVELKNSYTDITPIKDSKNYYTYESVGCSDYNWESYLVKIENFKLIKIGQIIGKGCESENKSIDIIKENQILEHLTYTKYITNYEDKWTFIENYWSKNLNKFISK